MNIFIRELKTNAKSLFIWCLSMVFLIWAGMVKYSAFAKTGEAVNEMMAQIPEEMKAAIGIGNGADLTSIAVFYSIFFMFFMLLAAVHSSMLGALIIAKEERDKTADFLFVKPVKRQRVISFKILTAIVNLIIFNLVTFFVSVIFVEKYNTGDSLAFPIFLITSALFIIQVLFLGFGLLLGAAAKSSKAASSIASSVILSTFILKVIIDLNSDLEKLQFLSPFMYFKSDAVMFDKQIDPGFTILSISVALVCVFGTYFFFRKRDLHS